MRDVQFQCGPPEGVAGAVIASSGGIGSAGERWTQLTQLNGGAAGEGVRERGRGGRLRAAAFVTRSSIITS